MSDRKFIVITGAAGFIGSCMVSYFNHIDENNLILVDDFSRLDKAANLIDKTYRLKVHRDQLFDWLDIHHQDVKVIIHLGAKTDTTLQDLPTFKRLNTDYTKSLFDFCTEHQLRLIYASSAATYGNGELGYIDDSKIINQLKPLNPYAVSKNDIDKYIFKQEIQPPQLVALKFFNVYGPNEYHKGRMASVVYHAYNEILKSGYVTLFRSHKEGIEDGEQMRDFIYVKDIAKVIGFLVNTPEVSGLFNLGTGQARSFKDLVNSLFTAIQHNATINFIDTPENIRDTYQYFTEADMNKLKKAGYQDAFYTLEEGVKDYATQYLEKSKCW